MKKQFFSLFCAIIILPLVSIAQAQVTPIKVCANGASVSVNQLCPEEQRQTSSPRVMGRHDTYGVISHAKGSGYFRFDYGLSTSNVINDAKVLCVRSGSNCEKILLIHNQCYAVAQGTNHYAVNPGNSLEQAKQRALRTCNYADRRGCKIVLSGCTARK